MYLEYEFEFILLLYLLIDDQFKIPHLKVYTLLIHLDVY